MRIDDRNLQATIRKMRDRVLEDIRVDKAEVLEILAFVRPLAPKYGEMAEFVRLLERVLEDGKVTPEESVRVGAYLTWLTREDEQAAPPVRETGFLGRIFRLGRNRTTAKTEVVAGVTMFMTMAYILAVNPSILSVAGIPRGGVFVATALAAVVGTLLMAVLSNYPFVLAPGMGLNAFLTFGVCKGMGYSWQFALLAVFVEGLVFLALSLTPVREAIFNCIPSTLKKAVTAGIGLFICFIALQTSGVIGDNGAVLVQMIRFREAPIHSTGICALLALVGTILTAVMTAWRWKGAILIGIFATWGLGMLAQATGLYVPDPSARCLSLYPSLTFAGLADTFKSFGGTFCAIFDPAGWTHTVDGKVAGSGWSLALSLDFFVVMFAFFFVDLFDTLGTLIGVSMKGGFLTREGKLPRVSGALCADAIATSVGARRVRLGRDGRRTDGSHGRHLRGAFRAGARLRAGVPRDSVVRDGPCADHRRLHDALLGGRDRLHRSERGDSRVPRDRRHAVRLFDLRGHHVGRHQLHAREPPRRQGEEGPLDPLRPDAPLRREVRVDVRLKG